MRVRVRIDADPGGREWTRINGTRMNANGRESDGTRMDANEREFRMGRELARIGANC